MCARAVHSLVCMPCFVLERGVLISTLISWVLVSWRVLDTHAPCSVLLCECAVSGLLSHALFCPRVFCVVARSSCFYRLRAFMLCLVLCDMQLVLFIRSLLSCCHVLCEQEPTLNTSLTDSYRPVSLLPFIAKTLERVVLNSYPHFCQRITYWMLTN